MSTRRRLGLDACHSLEYFDAVMYRTCAHMMAECLEDEDGVPFVLDVLTPPPVGNYCRTLWWSAFPPVSGACVETTIGGAS